jgi:hypothetical protein
MRTRKDWPGERRVFAWWHPADGEDRAFPEFYEKLEDCPAGAIVGVFRLESLKRVVFVPAKRVLKPVTRPRRRRRAA